MLRSVLGSHRPLTAYILIMTALVPVCVAGLLLDDRMISGEPIWAKPLKFSVSAAVYSLSLAWFITFLRRWHRVGWWAGTVVAVAGTVEVGGIVFQVLRGKRSHFNVETPFDAQLLSILGMLIMLVWVMHAIIAVLLLFNRLENRPLAASIRLGLFIAMIGLAVGVQMATPQPGQPGRTGTVGGHSVGVPDAAVGGHLPVLGWNTDAGDLRVPHFIGIHAVQVLPIAIALFGRYASVRLAWVLAGAYTGLFVLSYWQAVRGQSLVRPDSLTLAAFACLVAVTSAAVYLAVRQPRKQVIPV